MSLRGRLIPISLVLVAASLLFFAALPDDVVYDIDFTGGLKLQARFARQTSVDEVKEALAGAPRDVTVVREAHGEDAAAVRHEVGHDHDASAR